MGSSTPPFLRPPTQFSHTVRRLDDAAIRKEVKGGGRRLAATASTAVDGGVVDGKGDGERTRKGASDEVNGGASLNVAKLQGMGYRELQGLAKAQGLVATGSKKELVERLSACASAVEKDCDGDVDKKGKRGKIVTATKKGAAVLDQIHP